MGGGFSPFFPFSAPFRASNVPSFDPYRFTATSDASLEKNRDWKRAPIGSFLETSSLRVAALCLDSTYTSLINFFCFSLNFKLEKKKPLTGEDLLQLLLSNVCALLDQLATLLGTSAGSPPPAAVAATLCAVLAVNSAAHVAVLHLLYSALLRAVGLQAPPMPVWVAKKVGVTSGAGGSRAGNDPLSAR